jgi:hypothetical protein
MQKGILLGIFTVFAFAGVVRQADARCASGLLACYQRAANIESFWGRWASGLDCEVDFVECARSLLIGA